MAPFTSSRWIQMEAQLNIPLTRQEPNTALATAMLSAGQLLSLQGRPLLANGALMARAAPNSIYGRPTNRHTPMQPIPA